MNKNQLVGVVAVTLATTTFAQALQLPATYNELSATKTRYRALRDRALRSTKVEIRRKKAYDLLRAALATAEDLSKSPAQDSWKSEALVARASLLPVLLDYSNEALKSAGSPKSKAELATARSSFARTSRNSAKAVPGLASGSVSPASVRRWYEAQRSGLPDVIDSLRDSIKQLEASITPTEQDRV